MLKSVLQSKRLWVIDIIILFPVYILVRLRQLFVFAWSAFEVMMGSFSGLKQQLVRRMFWGRGSLYKSSFHLVVLLFTVVLLVTGIVGRLNVTEAKQSLTVAYGTFGNNDLIEQGASLTSVAAIEDVTQANYTVSRHVVESGETLAGIATQYSVSADTIRWANDKLISTWNDNIRVGWELLIPQMDGVLYTAKSGDNLDKVVAYTSGNKFDIIELNSLVPPDYSITTGQRIFVPNGKIIPPPQYPVFIVHNPGSGGYVGSGVVPTSALAGFPAGYFDDPLTNSACSGYVWMRGFSSWHNGVDLAVAGGCPIRAIAWGTVTYAGLNIYGAGYTVVIDHGGGVESQYYHGDGNIWVRVGQYVNRGQDIMYMGETGHSTGIHVHLTIKLNGVAIDPAPYVPYRRPY